MSRLFFKPVYFHFQPTYLAVKLILFFFGIVRLPLSPFTENIDGLFQQLLFPGIDLARVNIKFCRYLIHCLMTLQSFDRDLGFEL